MGASATVFFSYQDEAETLNKRVTLLPEQLEYARQNKGKLLSYLKNEVSCRLDVTLVYWLQGSYKNHTLIRPVRKGEEFDIDAGLYLLFNAESSGVQSADAKRMLHEVLNKYCNKNQEPELADSKSNCERVCYPSSFHIDLPLYYYDNVTSTCRLATENSGWIDSDPKALQDWFDNKISYLTDTQRARLRRIIKYLKTWATLKFVKLPSIAITVYIAESYDDLERDDDAFIKNAEKLANYLLKGGEIQSPINGDDLLGRASDERSKLSHELGNLLENIQLASNCHSAIEAHPYWTRIFEHIYPPIAEIIEQNMGANLPILTTPPAINVRKKDKNNHFIEDTSADSISAHLDEKLDFTIANADSYLYGSVVKWMVRNKDKEASIANDLGHQKILQLNDICDEHCGYRGTHYMECVIEANGIIQGACSIKVQISGMARPMRNPPKRTYGPRR